MRTYISIYLYTYTCLRTRMIYLPQSHPIFSVGINLPVIYSYQHVSIVCSSLLYGYTFCRLALPYITTVSSFPSWIWFFPLLKSSSTICNLLLLLLLTPSAVLWRTVVKIYFLLFSCHNIIHPVPLPLRNCIQNVTLFSFLLQNLFVIYCFSSASVIVSFSL